MKETFDLRLQNLRKMHNFTQEDIANKVNVTPQAVSKWENDLAEPDLQTLPLLANILNVSVDELLGITQTVTQLVEPVTNFKNYVLKITVDSADGDKVRVNLPLAFISACLDEDKKIPLNLGVDTTNIDFKEIIALVKQGVIGEIISVDSADGDKVNICVEKYENNH